MSPLLHTAPSEQAQAHPAAAAVVCNGVELSYGELECLSNRLAQLLVGDGCTPGDRVGLLMPKVPAAIVGMLGVLKAGAAYVPLDPADPVDRLAKTLARADCRWILAAGPVGQRLRESLGCAQLQRQPRIGWLDDPDAAAAELPVHFTRPDLDAFSDTAPGVAVSEDSLAHILFTSGSTGTPKGVMITHANVAHAIGWAIDRFRITAADRILQHASLRFDLSTMDIFAALSTGASLWLVPPEFNVLPTRLAALIRDAGITHWLVVPSMLNLMAKFDVVRNNDFPDLRRILSCGEVLPTPALIHWMRRLPHVTFTNLYGPTETTICSSYHTVPHCPEDEREPIPIGVACEGEELLVLDEHRQPVADGETGDLYIAGPGLSPGYWQEPDKTRQAFFSYTNGAAVPKRIYRTGDLARRDAAGLYHFCGRSDTQIKSRGYRIELGEIEAALHTLLELRESAVLAIEAGGFEGARICCAYATDPGAETSPERLRSHLARLLPPYMLPVRWKHYDVLPKNGNGKLDRARLRSEFSQALNDERDEAREGTEAYDRRPKIRLGAAAEGAVVD